jgi:hypothetical protein
MQENLIYLPRSAEMLSDVKELNVSGETRHVAVTSTIVDFRHGFFARQLQSSSLHKIRPCKSSHLYSASLPYTCNMC